MRSDVIFEPLKLGKLTVKNRVVRSSISGRFDNYDGSGNHVRINWEEKFARGGVGAIISSFVPVSIRGRIVPGYATIDRDDNIPFWREVGRRVRQHEGCLFLMQLSHSGRQQDLGGIENRYRKAFSSTNQTEGFHGFLCQAMSHAEIQQVVQEFGEGARRAQEAGLDGVELHGCNGYLINQFLSSGINDRTDEYGGSLENRARFVREIVREIRKRAPGFHLQMKISVVDHNDALFPWEKKGNTQADSIQVCKWLLQDGVDAFHVSSGSMFPHPRNPAGDFPMKDARDWYDLMLSAGIHTDRNYFIFRNRPLWPLFRWWWRRTQDKVIEGQNLPDSYAVRAALHSLPEQQKLAPEDRVKILCTGGFQTASIIRMAIQQGMCDAVTIARPLIANNDLVHMFAKGLDRPPKPCTYCNRCLLSFLENPLGCYDLTRYDHDHDRMVREIMTVFDPPCVPPAPPPLLQIGAGPGPGGGAPGSASVPVEPLPPASPVELPPAAAADVRDPGAESAEAALVEPETARPTNPEVSRPRDAEPLPETAPDAEPASESPRPDAPPAPPAEVEAEPLFEPARPTDPEVARPAESSAEPAPAADPATPAPADADPTQAKRRRP